MKDHAEMSNSPNLSLPFLLASQAQKHVTHNEALQALDCLVQLCLLTRSLASPPASPAEGNRYLVASGATGAWIGQAGKIATYQDAVWAFYAPKEGFIAWVADENIAIAYDSGSWLSLSSGGGVTAHSALTGLSADDHPQYLNNARGDARYTPIAPATLPINGATADTTNRLALSSAASLFNHAGNGHQAKINKATASDTASFLFQTGFSGRAEIGTTGDDDFHFKVSPNGSTFYEAIRVDRATGRLSFPIMGGPLELLTANRTYYVRTDGSNSNSGLVDSAGGAFLTLQKAWDTLIGLDLGGYTATIQIKDGTFTGGITANISPRGGSVVIQGNSTTPDNVLLSLTSANAFYFNCQCDVQIKDLKITTATGGYGIAAAQQGAKVSFGNINFGACAGDHLRAVNGGSIAALSNYKISGGAPYHLAVDNNGTIEVLMKTITISGTPAFSSFFAYATARGYISLFSNTWSGGATGARYYVATYGFVRVFGAGATHLPGNSAGTADAASYGLYA